MRVCSCSDLHHLHDGIAVPMIYIDTKDIIAFSFICFSLGKRTPKKKEKKKKKKKNLMEQAQKQHSFFLATDQASQ